MNTQEFMIQSRKANICLMEGLMRTDEKMIDIIRDYNLKAACELELLRVCEANVENFQLELKSEKEKLRLEEAEKLRLEECQREYDLKCQREYERQNPKTLQQRALELGLSVIGGGLNTAACLNGL
jgi:hypothetical protein